MKLRAIFLVIVITAMLSGCVVRPAHPQHGKAKKQVVVVEKKIVIKKHYRH